MTIIGIDPDMRASGVAVVVGKDIQKLNNVRLPELVKFISEIGQPHQVTIKLENPEANKGLFACRANKNKAVSIAIATDVGKVMASTYHIKELLEAAGYSVKLITPLKGELKQKAKTDAAYFNKLTGWQKKSNADQRDAALIALWG